MSDRSGFRHTRNRGTTREKALKLCALVVIYVCKMMIEAGLWARFGHNLIWERDLHEGSPQDDYPPARPASLCGCRHWSSGASTLVPELAAANPLTSR